MRTNALDLALHIPDDLLSTLAGSHDSGDHGDVRVDVSELFGRKAEKASAGFHDLGNGFLLIGHSRDHEIGMHRENRFAHSSPRIGDNGYVRIADLGTNVHAVFRAGHNTIELAESGKNDCRAGLQRNDALRIVIGLHLAMISEIDPHVGQEGTLRKLQFCQMYSPQVLEHFQNPRNAGEVANPTASVQIENPACGDILKLTLRVADGCIAEIRFRAKGCVPAMACASLLTEMVQGKTLAEARGLRKEQLVQAVGGLPEASGHAGQLAIDALTTALKDLRP